MMEHKIILQGICGSVAYGLDTPESDVDQRGAFVLPTEDILSVYPTTETIDRVEPDICWHEVGKFVRLALQNNPNILETFYLDEYEVLTDEGKLLLDIRESFLSQRVRNTYGGYAVSQVKRLQNRGDGSFKSKLRKRYSKHARHCVRLLQQGAEILETGNLTVKVANPKEIWAVGELDPQSLVEKFEIEFAEFNEVKSDLPLEPDYATINKTLLRIRNMNYKL